MRNLGIIILIEGSELEDVCDHGVVGYRHRLEPRQVGAERQS